MLLAVVTALIVLVALLLVGVVYAAHQYRRWDD